MKQLKQVSCDPTCGFLLRSHDEKEVVDLAMVHAKKAHPTMKVTADDIRKMVKNA